MLCRFRRIEIEDTRVRCGWCGIIIIRSPRTRKIAIKLRAIEPDEREGRPTARHREEVSRARRRPMAAAASAAISMEMRWMSAILYDKISPQKTVWVNRAKSPYPAGVAVRKEKRERTYRKMHVAPRALSVHLGLADARKKGNAFPRMSRNTAMTVLERNTPNETSPRLLRSRSPMKSSRSRNFPRTDVSLSPFARPYNSTPCWIKYRRALSFRFANRTEGEVLQRARKREGKKQEMKLPFQSKQLRTR